MFRPRPLDSRLRGNDGLWSLARLNAIQGGGSDRFLAEEDEFGVVWGIAFDVEAGEVRAGGGGMAVVVLAIPARPVCAGGERRVHECANALALDVVDGYVDGCGVAEVEAEVGGCVEGVGPHLERHCRDFGR